MKHIVAILAHKNPKQVELLVKRCFELGFEVLLHVDIKALDLFNQNKFLYPLIHKRSFNVRRGHFSIVQAAIELMQEANEENFDYFHLISGEDFPIKSKAEFDAFFSKNRELSFVNHFPIPLAKSYEKNREDIFSSFKVFRDRLPQENYAYKFYKNGIGLVDTFHFTEGSLLANVVRYFTRFNSFKRLYHAIAKRKLPQLDYYGGSGWFSINQDLVRLMLAYISANSKTLRYFKHSLFPDEILLQTIALHVGSENIVNSDLRYINWDKPVNNGPGIITLEEVPKMKQSNGFFARKFDLIKNPELLTEFQ